MLGSRRRSDEPTRILSMPAHEFRAPLAPPRSALEIIERVGGERAHSTMERQLDQMTRLRDDLLDLRRIRPGMIELERERIELAAVLRQALEASRPLADAAQVHLDATLPTDPIFLDADPARMAQVFGHLLSNACRFTGAGGRVWLRVRHSDGEVAVIVKDTGIGIEPDLLPRIFERSTESDRPARGSRGGLGIGLSLVRRLVELHGGSVRARSEGAGRGSEFEVRLVVAQIEAATKASAPPAPGEPLASRRVLVVDDNADSAAGLALLLEMIGHEAHTARDGFEAVERAERIRPDVVLLDVGLPGLNGHEVCRRIREQPWGKDILLVAITGWGEDEDRRKSLEAGFDLHLVKPVDHRRLLQLIASRSVSG